MDEEEFNYKTLRHVQQTEKNSPLLTKIHTHFYVQLSQFLKELDRRAKKEEKSEKGKLFIDEIQNMRKIATSIYDLREKKIVQAALSTAHGGKPDLTNLVDEEKTLYESLLALIQEHRRTLVAEKQEQKEPKKTELMKPVETNESKGNSNPIVRVTADIPEFMGTDMRTYKLHTNDVLSLPKEMSEPLQTRGVVKQIT